MRKVTLFFAAALFSLLSFAQDNNADIVKVGDSMPAFTLHSTVNGTVSSEDLKGKVVLINIFATWCGPCKMFGPVFEEVSNEFNINFVKINVDNNADIARKYGVMSIPTIILFKDGIEVKRFTGFMSKEEFVKFLK